MFGGVKFFEFKDKKIAQRYLIGSPKGSLKLFQADKFWCYYNTQNERFFCDKNNELFIIMQGDIRILGKDRDKEILDLYKTYGQDFIKHIAGIFSCVLWDSKNSVLILSVDLFGIKPMYYHTKSKNGLLFSNSINPLINCINPKLNDAAVYQFMVFGFVVGNECIAEDINKISNSSYLIYTSSQSIKVHKYYDIRISPENKPFEYYRENIATKLFEIVKDYSKDTDKASVAFSGGLDSSIILSLLSKLNKTVSAFTAVIEGKQDDRARYVKEYAEHYCSDYREIVINENKVAKYFTDSINHMSQPVCDTDAPIIFILTKSLKNSPLVFFGKGADELYCSSEHYRLKSGNIKAPMNFSKTLNSNIIFSLPYLVRSKKIEKNSLMKNNLLKHNLRFFHSISKFGFFELNRQFFDLAYYIGSETSTPDAIYTKNNVNYIYPFLDKEFVNLSLKIPLAYKRRENIDKYILRNSFSKILMKQIYRAPKLSTSIPPNWITDNVSSEEILDKSKLLKKYFKKEYLKKVDKDANSKEFISLLILELWHQNFLAVGGKESE